MAHFARFATGMTCIDADFSASGLEGSAYLSITGDTVVVVMANTTDSESQIKMDLPFYTQSGQQRTTTKTKNFESTDLSQNTETCRPIVKVPAQSVSTVLFVRSADRQPSTMTGNITRFDRLDDMATTKSNFGTAYKMSGKTKTFDQCSHQQPYHTGQRICSAERPL